VNLDWPIGASGDRKAGAVRGNLAQDEVNMSVDLVRRETGERPEIRERNIAGA